MTTLKVGLALLAVGALATGTAFAAPALPNVRTVTVQYMKSSLDAPGGAEKLYQRIRAAARQACGDDDSRDIVHFFLFKGCYQAAVDSAVEKVDASSLTALHRKAQRTAAG